MPISVPPPPPGSDRSANMRAIRRRDTKPELLVRAGLHKAGLRFRVDYPLKFPGARVIRPDVAFTRWRVAVFVDGCFWHGCPQHGLRREGRNADYWGPKIARNAERDAEQAALLELHGWRVLRFWEHEDPARVTAVVAAAVAASRSRPR